MDEQATFEPRSVLGPRRTGWSRLGIVIPAVLLAGIAWAGVSGARSHQQVADVPDSGAVASSSNDAVASSLAVAPESGRQGYPTQALGLEVQRLDGIIVRGLGRDTPVAVTGWYVATAITDCPPLAAIYRAGSLPDVRGDADELAFCERSGVLYASRPELTEGLPKNNLEDNRSTDAGPPAVATTLVVGVVVPPELEMIGADATQVVVIGRFIESGGVCPVPAGCVRELVVDYVAWAAGL
jgi:hypothetical protein